MHADNFAPKAAAGAGAIVLSPETYKKLAVEVRMNEDQFTCEEKPGERIYTYLTPTNPAFNQSGSTTGMDFDLILIGSFEGYLGEEAVTLNFRAGQLVSTNPEYTGLGSIPNLTFNPTTISTVMDGGNLDPA